MADLNLVETNWGWQVSADGEHIGFITREDEGYYRAYNKYWHFYARRDDLHEVAKALYDYLNREKE